MRIISKLIKPTIAFLLFFSPILMFSQTKGDSIFVKQSNVKVETRQSPNSNGNYVFCDNNQDGFLPIDIGQIKNDVLNENALLIATATGVYICNSGSEVHLIDNLSGVPQMNYVGYQYGTSGWSTIDIATNLNNELFISEANQIHKIDNTTCQILTTYDFGLDEDSSITSLSFDTNNNMYLGGFDSSVYRSSGDLSSYQLWHDFGSGFAAGDFVIYSDKMYIAWRIGGICKLYEVTLDSNFNYVSHIDLGNIPNPTYGLASELGRLYGIHPDYLYEIDLSTFTFTTVLVNNSYYDWYGSAGKNEGVSFSTNAFETLSNAQNNTNPLPNLWTNTVSGGQTIYVSIVNNLTNQSQIIPVNLVINLAPDYVSPIEISHCINDVDATLFDIGSTESMIIGNQSNIVVSYHESMTDAVDNANPLPDVYVLSSSSYKFIYVRLQNTITGCLSYFNFKIVINPLPYFTQPDDLIYCSRIDQAVYNEVALQNQIESILEFSNALENSVIFYHSNLDALNNSNPISLPYYTTTAHKEVFFAVINSVTGCKSVSSFMVDVLEENNNFLETVKVESFDWTNNENSIAITVNGTSTYEYSLDGYVYQKEKNFTNLSTGIYTIYVKNLSDCSVFEKQVTLLFYLNFFTPNNDGHNDFWRIKFSENEPNIQVLIYDRYGKFLANISPNDLGWDGTYQNIQLPSSDYWFVVKRENGIEHRGHFSLKR